MKMVNRLIDITEGDITIGGSSVGSLDVTELRRSIGYVIQQVGLFPHMSVADNIAVVPRLLGWPKARIAERVDELLDLVDLPPARLPRALSRHSCRAASASESVLPARSRPTRPVMVMDEPFGALDPITRARLQQELLRIHHEVRKTIIFVTHDIDEAILLGDRIAILREGGVLAQYDAPEAILARPGGRVRRALRRRRSRAQAPGAAATRRARPRAARRRSTGPTCGRVDDAPRRALAHADDRLASRSTSSTTRASRAASSPSTRSATLER